MRVGEEKHIDIDVSFRRGVGTHEFRESERAQGRRSLNFRRMVSVGARWELNWVGISLELHGGL